jgi:chemotaxis protein methyltransferase CheR
MDNNDDQVFSREFVMTDQEFYQLTEIAHNRSGIVFADSKKDMVYSRLARRLRALNLKDFGAYHKLLTGPEGAVEMDNFINAVTTNLTNFFREIHHFEHLQSKVLEPAFANPPLQKRLRIWSAGCSTGMEPYSIAMVLAPLLSKHPGWDARILATDIDTSIIREAIAGEYPDSELEDIPEKHRDHVEHFPDKECISMDRKIRQLITFKPLNLLEQWPVKGPFDVIFCRNVVIYFDKPTQKVLFNRFADLLKPGGWLYIGHSENLNNVCDRFKLIGRTTYQKVS